ncbi:unnamed protein product [Brachionus calyciflorus]|uniref:C2H2-type domain-containing protein n=1 Tax=Brachionus calyciflorus TaxID=104777 RepID=A0A813ZPK7_9BILA|nr:unnamed protein product [Brachionus calyciflorus]
MDFPNYRNGHEKLRPMMSSDNYPNYFPNHLNYHHQPFHNGINYNMHNIHNFRHSEPMSHHRLGPVYHYVNSNENHLNYHYQAPRVVTPRQELCLMCDECPKVFCSQEYLELHKKNKHPKKDIVYIQIPSQTTHECNLKFVPKDFNKSPSPSSETYCEICRRNFCNKYFLIKHKKSVHSKKNGELSNDIETQSVNSNNSLFTKKNWYCNYCKKEYYSYKYLLNHFLSKHKEQYLRSVELSQKIGDNENVNKIRRQKILLKKHILMIVKKRMEKCLEKNGCKNMPKKSSLISMIRLIKFLSSNRFRSFYKCFNWKQMFKKYILSNTKQFKANKCVYGRKKYLIQEFQIKLDNGNFLKDKIKFPNLIKLKVCSFMKEEISIGFLKLRPIDRNRKTPKM